MSLRGVTGRMLARNGRPMVLKRRIGTSYDFAEATVQGFMTAYSPEEITGLLMQGDARVVIAPVAGALATPAANDVLVVDGFDWTVMGATPRHVGSTLDGWTLWVRGGGA